MKEHWLEITDIKKLTNFSRKLIFNSFNESPDTIKLENAEFFTLIENMSDSELTELESILPYKESEMIIKSFIKTKKHKKTSKIIHLMKESNYGKVLEDLNQRMVSNIIRNLVSKGVVETAFDEEKNDFVFWIKEDK